MLSDVNEATTEEIKAEIRELREIDAKYYAQRIRTLTSELTDRALGIRNTETVDASGFPIALKDDEQDGLPF